MATRSLRYVEVHQQKAPFVFHVERVQYRDKKGRVVKFDKRKKLKVEIVGKREVYDKKKKKLVKKSFTVKSYALKARKRQRPVTVAQTNRRIETRAAKHKKSLTMVIEEGITQFRYLWKNKKMTKSQKLAAKRRRNKEMRAKGKRIVKKGSKKHERKKSQ